VTATRKTAKHKNPEPKPTAAPKPVTVKPKKKDASVKTVADKLTTTLVVTTQPTTYPPADISDLDNLPL